MRHWYSPSRLGSALLAPLCVVAGTLAVPAQARPDEGFRQFYSAGIDHYFNREFDLAVDSFSRALERAPQHPRAHFQFGKALLYQELHRLGMVGTSVFHDDREYNDFERPKPDPQVKTRIRDTLARGRALCESILETAPDDRMALHALAGILALRGAFEFMVTKAYFTALAHGRRARAVSYRLAEFHPDFVDGLLVAGLDEYILGSLPWAARALIAVSGYRGHRRKGREKIIRVATEGSASRHEARVLLAVLLRKEERYIEAGEAFRGLAEDFPRAYTFALESAAMDLAAGHPEAALVTLREVQRKRLASEHRHDRMPPRLAAALARRIAKIERDLESKRQPAGDILKPVEQRVQ